MNRVGLADGFRIERLSKAHPRKAFVSKQTDVDDWLQTKALPHQVKHLSVTKVLLDKSGAIAGYFTLATGQVDFADLPAEAAKKLPRRMLPVAVLAWLGVNADRQGQGLGKMLLAQALRDCHEAGRTFAFIAVILDSIDDKSKAFYQHFDFAEFPGRPYRLFLTVAQLDAMMNQA